MPRSRASACAQAERRWQLRGAPGWAATWVLRCGRVLVLVLVLDEVAGIGDQRAGIGCGFAAAPAGGVRRVEPAADLAQGALAAGRNLLVAVAFALPPGYLVVPRWRGRAGMAGVVPGVVVPLVRVVGELEAGVDVLLVAGELAGRHVPDVGLGPGGGADADRPAEVGGDLGVKRLEAYLDVAFALEVGVEGQEVDHPRPLVGGERGDGLGVGDVVADHGDVEPERDA